MLQTLQNDEARSLETLLKEVEAMSNPHTVEALLVEIREMEANLLLEMHITT